MTENGRRYCLITPCRNEAEYARVTLDSVTRQSVAPACWVIVDDGSTDETPAILAEYAERFPYIRIVTRADRGGRSVGPGVVDAFYSGYEAIRPDEFDYVCKLDLDLDLPPGYFEGLMTRMEANPRLGTVSGKPYLRTESGELVAEKCGDEMSVGMSKFYRTRCFEEIGGFVRQVMWDGIDCHRCRMLGWDARSSDDADLRFVHLRVMGSSQKSVFVGRMRHGFGQYFMGTSFPFILVSALYRITETPPVVTSLGILWGYVKSWITRKPRYDDTEFRRFLRRYQWLALFRGKERAIETLMRDRRPADAPRPDADVSSRASAPEAVRTCDES